MTDSKSDQAHERFKKAATLLIATVTLVGALVAWRISVATGAASGADAKGLAAVLQSADATTNISTNLTSDLTLFAAYDQHTELAQLLERDAKAATDVEQQAILNEQAMRESNIATSAIAQIDDLNYVKTDTATGRRTFDSQLYLATQLADAKALKNLDYGSEFANADVKRNKARGLVGVTVLFSAALFLLTASMTTRHWAKFVLLSVALPLFLIGLVAVCVLEIFW